MCCTIRDITCARRLPSFTFLHYMCCAVAFTTCTIQSFCHSYSYLVTCTVDTQLPPMLHTNCLSSPPPGPVTRSPQSLAPLSHSCFVTSAVLIQWPLALDRNFLKYCFTLWLCYVLDARKSGFNFLAGTEILSSYPRSPDRLFVPTEFHI